MEFHKVQFLLALLACFLSAESSPILYYRLLTPNSLEDYTISSQVQSSTSTLLTFDPTGDRNILIRVPICISQDNIVVSIKVYRLPNIPSTADSDFTVGICDGEGNCNGVFLTDFHNYASRPCYFRSSSNWLHIGSANTNLLSCAGRTTDIDQDELPEEMTLTFYPREQWGSYHAPINGGFTATTTFADRVSTTGGCFYLYVVANEGDELYQLQYMQVEVLKNTC